MTAAARRHWPLGFADKFFFAPGAGDGDFSLATGNTHHLAALGAVEVAVIPVLQPIPELEKLPILLVALVGIPG